LENSLTYYALKAVENERNERRKEGEKKDCDDGCALSPCTGDYGAQEAGPSTAEADEDSHNDEVDDEGDDEEERENDETHTENDEDDDYSDEEYVNEEEPDIRKKKKGKMECRRKGDVSVRELMSISLVTIEQA